MKRLLLMILALGFFTSAALAHNGMEHVMGTVTAVSATSITVKTADGKDHTVVLNATTKYSKGTTTVQVKDLKVGDHVVVHAAKKGDALVAAEVKVGMMPMKGMSGDMGGMKMDQPHASQPH